MASYRTLHRNLGSSILKSTYLEPHTIWSWENVMANELTLKFNWKSRYSLEVVQILTVSPFPHNPYLKKERVEDFLRNTQYS